MSLLINRPVKTLFYAFLGFLVRIVVTATFKEPIRQSFEVSTPVNNWKRAYEAVHLWKSGLDPYSGNIFHEYPISLQFYKILITYFNIDLVFIGTDIITAILLQQSTLNQHVLYGQDKEEASIKGFRVLFVYLFSPLTILSCTGNSTAIFTNFLVAVINFILPMKPFRALTCVLCALLACNNIHYSTLIIPIFLCLEYCSFKKYRADKADQDGSTYYQSRDFWASMWSSAIISSATLVTLIATSYFLMGNSWTFAKATYLFVLKIQDLTPNIGMFWYFFTEMFEHFLAFFTWIVQINAFIHVVPLSVCLRDNPFFALYIMILTSTIFQPYPSLSNIGIITSLLPQWSDLFPHMKRGLFISCAAVTCLSLMPLFWYLWIMMGTANSNFYFGATLGLNVAMIFLMVDLLNAHGYVKAKLKLDKYRSEQTELSDKKKS